MTNPLLALLAAALLADPAPPAAPHWQADYRAALRRAERDGKPLAVVVGEGPAGWAGLVRDGPFDAELARLFDDGYVGLYLDSSTAAGRRLAEAFQVGRLGLVISDRTGRVQALAHEGALAREELRRYLRHFADPDYSVRTTATGAPDAAAGAPVRGVAPVPAALRRPRLLRPHHRHRRPGRRGRGADAGRAAGRQPRLPDLPVPAAPVVAGGAICPPPVPGLEWSAPTLPLVRPGPGIGPRGDRRMPWSSVPSPRSRAGHRGELPLRALILFLPAGLLLGGSLRADGPPQQMLGVGAALECVLGLGLIRRRRVWRPPTGLVVIGLYLIGLLWLTLGTVDFSAWYPHLAQALLVLVPLLLFAAQMLSGSGLTAVRQARLLGQRLAERKEWPEDLAACRSLPEVKALREAVHPEAAPALALLHHPRPQVRLVALAALEFRKSWRPGQAELILQLAKQEPVPAVRAAAVSALANLDDRRLVEALVPFLYDSDAGVRRAAAEALLWDAESRWPWLRLSVHAALLDPRAGNDGPLPFPGADLPQQAVLDLTGWASEPGSLGLRAALTLVDHYSRTLIDGATEPFLDRLRAEVADPHVAAVLRLEVARLLLDHGELPAALREQLLDTAQPAPLRLLAAETLLKAGPHPGAVQALREVARQPNREIALASAALVQRLLGVDMGLALNHPLPALQSRLAADVTRRVMLWATQPPRESPEAVTLPSPPERDPGLSVWASGVRDLPEPNDPGAPPRHR
jgi:hypothetical protein